MLILAFCALDRSFVYILFQIYFCSKFSYLTPYHYDVADVTLDLMTFMELKLSL